MPQVIKDYFPGFWHHQDKGEKNQLFQKNINSQTTYPRSFII